MSADNEEIAQSGCIKLAVIGWRGFTDYTLAKKSINEWISINGQPAEIISGGARGADSLAERYASEYHIPVQVFKPDWATQGRAAGILRNTDIIAASTHVLAFVSKHSVGTFDSIRKAERAGIPVTRVNVD